MIDGSDLSPAWRKALRPALSSPSMEGLKTFLEEEKAAQKRIYPSSSQVFHALSHVEPRDVRVVILGQDPYHGEGQAHGLSFSVQKGVRVPPSLKNIYKELHSDLGYKPVKHGFLEAWAEQGVLLLNSSLTVEHGQPASHSKKGWEPFTDAIIAAVAKGPPAAFLLWGKHAQEKASAVDETKHLVIKTSHPSPMGNSANKGFFGSRPFSRANAFLNSRGRKPINWQLPE